MTNLSVSRKNFDFQYRGSAALVLNATNAPWLNKVLRIYRPSTGSALAVQSYAGSYNGATPGGAVTQLVPGYCYRMVAGVYDGSWSIPDSILVDDIGTAAPTVGSVFKLSENGFVDDTILQGANGTAADSVYGIEGVDQTDKLTAVFAKAKASGPFSTVIVDVAATISTAYQPFGVVVSVVDKKGFLQKAGVHKKMWWNENPLAHLNGNFNISGRSILIQCATAGGEGIFNGNGFGADGQPRRNIQSSDNTGWNGVFGWYGVDGLFISGIASLNARSINTFISNCRNWHINFSRCLRSERYPSGTWGYNSDGSLKLPFEQTARSDGPKMMGPIENFTYSCAASFTSSDDCCSVIADGDVFHRDRSVDTYNSQDIFGGYGTVRNGRINVNMIAGPETGVPGAHGIRLMSRTEKMIDVHITLTGKVYEFLGVQDNYVPNGYSRPNATYSGGYYEGITVDGGVEVTYGQSTYERTCGWLIRAGIVKRQAFQDLNYKGPAPFCLIAATTPNSSETTATNVDVLYGNNLVISGVPDPANGFSYDSAAVVKVLAGNAFDGTGVTPSPQPRSNAAYVQQNTPTWDVNNSPNQYLQIDDSTTRPYQSDFSTNRPSAGKTGVLILNNPSQTGLTYAISSIANHRVYGSTSGKNVFVAAGQKVTVQVDFTAEYVNYFVTYDGAATTTGTPAPGGSSGGGTSDPNYGGPARQTPSTAAFVALNSTTMDMSQPNRTLGVENNSPDPLNLTFSNTAVGQVGQLRIKNNDTVSHTLQLDPNNIHVVYSSNGNTTKTIVLAPGAKLGIQIDFTQNTANYYVNYAPTDF